MITSRFKPLFSLLFLTDLYMFPMYLEIKSFYWFRSGYILSVFCFILTSPNLNIDTMKYGPFHFIIYAFSEALLYSWFIKISLTFLKKSSLIFNFPSLVFDSCGIHFWIPCLILFHVVSYFFHSVFINTFCTVTKFTIFVICMRWCFQPNSIF